MSDLDTKLREILTNGWYLKEEKGPWENGSMQVITPKPETIAQIKQVFADEGWKPGLVTFHTIDPTHMMNGVQFYERFEKELTEFVGGARTIRTTSAQEAAKKAAGLE